MLIQSSASSEHDKEPTGNIIWMHTPPIPAISITQQALELAARAHNRQRRKRSGLPYITHCIVVRDLVAANGGSEAAQAAALLHDVLEDTNYTLEDFPQVIIEMVRFLTVQKGSSKTEAIKKLRGASKETVLIKLCDRYHNMVDTLRFLDQGFKREWVETTNLLLHIAKDKGLQRTSVYIDLEKSIKQVAELEDNSGPCLAAPGVDSSVPA